MKTTIMKEKKLSRSKRGVRYPSNPFISTALINTKDGVKRIIDKTGTKMMVVSTSGEILAPVGFWQTQDVDKTQFVKLYVNGVKAFKDLTSAGTKVFEILYLKVQGSVGKDELWLTFPSIDQNNTPIGETTFYRGMKELLTKSFIAESETPGLYFLNPDYMWNGDRLAFVREYRKKTTVTEQIKNIENKTLDWVGNIDNQTKKGGE